MREDANNKLTASSSPHCPRSFILRLGAHAWPTKKRASNIRETLTLLERQGKRKSDRMDRGRRAQRETQTAVSGKRTDQTDIYIYIFLYSFFVSFAFAAISVFLYAIVRPLARFGIAAAFRPLFQRTASLIAAQLRHDTSHPRARLTQSDGAGSDGGGGASISPINALRNTSSLPPPRFHFQTDTHVVPFRFVSFGHEEIWI